MAGSPEQGFWIEIEGLRRRFSYGATPPDPNGNRIDHDLLVGPPDSVSDSVDPINGDFDLASFTFRITASRERVEGLSPVEVLMYQQTQPDAFLFNNLDTIDDQITLDTEDQLFDVGDSIYINRETMRVTSVFPPDSGTRAYNVTRGVYGSDVTEHAEGDGAYQRIPRWRGRRISLRSRDQSKSPIDRTRWRGYVDRITRPGDGTTIRIEARNIWSAAKDTSVNRSSPTSVFSSVTVDPVEDEDRPIISGTVTLEEIPPGAGDEGDFCYLRVGDALVGGEITTIQPGGRTYVSIDGRPLLGTTIEVDDGGGSTEKEVRPAYVQSSVADIQWVLDGAPAVGVFSPSVLSLTDANYRDHPLTHAMLLLAESVLDNDNNIDRGVDFARGFSADLGGLFGDTFLESVQDQILRTRDLRVDHLVAGWDGDSFDVLELVIEKLMRPYGFFIGTDEQGRPIVSQFRALTADDAERVEQQARVIEPISGPWVGDTDLGLDSSIDTIDATVADLPWRDGGTSVEVEALNAGSGRSRLGDGARWSIDYSTVKEGRIGEIEERALRRSVLSAFGFPRIRVRVGDSDGSGAYSLGSYVRIDTLPVDGDYLVDSSGQSVEDIEEATDFYGVIVGRMWDPGPSTYELEILLNGYGIEFVRTRAPSAVVESVEQVASDRYIVETVDPSPFSYINGTDGDSFAEFVDPPYDISLADTSLSTLDTGAMTGVIDGNLRVQFTAQAPTVGDIIRLDESPEPVYPLTGLAVHNFLDDDSVYG